ncbi:hypothetical protein F5887DRAFT_1083826 [Amanita rubescens]|nr:hypothetical protein F5887DRAFT_1083826 [Amanita rubescens]
MAPPPPVQPASTPEHMSQWQPLLHYRFVNDLGQTWVRVERVPLSAEGKGRNLDDVIFFDVGRIPSHPVLTGVIKVSHAKFARLRMKKKTGPEQCGARNGEFPLLKDHRTVPIYGATSVLLGTWALTEHFNPDGNLLFSSGTLIIEIQNQGGIFQMRHLTVEEKQDHFAMARTCDLISNSEYVNELIFNLEPQHVISLAAAS